MEASETWLAGETNSVEVWGTEAPWLSRLAGRQQDADASTLMPYLGWRTDDIAYGTT
jgi:hypothetical protein